METTEGVGITNTPSPEDINDATSTPISEHVDRGKSALNSGNKIVYVKMEIIY